MHYLALGGYNAVSQPVDRRANRSSGVCGDAKDKAFPDWCLS
jgi:hypothetical protein